MLFSYRFAPRTNHANPRHEARAKQMVSKVIILL
jgi:hypothetical protein